MVCIRVSTVFLAALAFCSLLSGSSKRSLAWQEAGKSGNDGKSVKNERLAELLDLLQEQNDGPDQFKDPWVRTLKEIVEIGPAAVPQLIAELDASDSDDDMMLRCMGFCLRAIGDKRAAPALIRAIPKTLRKPGSDMGVSVDNRELADFLGANDLNLTSERNFTFGRPVREIFAALIKLTGHSFDDDELYSIFLDGTVRQRRLKEELFWRQAMKWGEWWEQNAAQQLQDKAFVKVNLAKPAAALEPKLVKKNLQHYHLTGLRTNWSLESFLDTKAETVFYDLDTGRRAKLPRKWNSEKDLQAKFAEIEKWAIAEGFDLMGAEYIAPVTGKSHFAIRPLALEAWELGQGRWKMTAEDITFESLISEGKGVKGWLLHLDPASQRFDPEAIAPFLFRTKDGTPGLLFVGVEVHDDSLQPGGTLKGDMELSPVNFHKGRRLGFSFFEELEEAEKK